MCNIRTTPGVKSYSENLRQSETLGEFRYYQSVNWPGQECPSYQTGLEKWRLGYYYAAHA